MNFIEAAHRLRVTTHLIKWFVRYSPKCDNRKLVEAASGEFAESELQAFDEYLWAPWSDRYVPAGIGDELRKEARGRCGVCEDTCDRLEEAHIERKDIERDHYCQHPANLILLCPNCHSRYDDRHLKAIDFQVVRHVKEGLVSRKMNAIDSDIARARAVVSVVDELKRELREQCRKLGTPESDAGLWVLPPHELIKSVATLSGYRLSLDLEHPQITLVAMSNTLAPHEHHMRAILDGYAREAIGGGATTLSIWERLGYENLPLINNQGIELARMRLDACGNENFDSDQYLEAFRKYEETVEAAKGDEFQIRLTTFPEEIRCIRMGLVTSVCELLGACRRCRSWDRRSEYKLPSWLEWTPESMIIYTSVANLRRIEANLRRYLEIHREMDDHNALRTGD